MLVTLSGIKMLVMTVSYWKAESPMPVTGKPVDRTGNNHRSARTGVTRDGDSAVGDIVPLLVA